MRIAIVGSSDLGQLMAHHAINDSKFDMYGFFDNRKDKGTSIGDYGKVVGSINDIEEHYDNNLFDGLILGIGYTQFPFKKETYEKLQYKIPFVNIIHTSSYIDTSVKIGKGIFVLPRCVVDMGCIIEDNVVLNTAVTIAHHTTIKRYSFLGPATAVAGYVKIGESNFIGINSTILNNIETCDNIIIGGGTVVNKSILEEGTYVGVPSRKIIK